MDGHFLKLLHAAPSEVLSKIIQPERVELETILRNLGSDEVRSVVSLCAMYMTWLFDDIKASEKPFVEKALEELKVRRN